LLQQSIIQTEGIGMPGQGSTFSFELAALHYGTPQEIRYAYIMEGFDTSWNYIGNRRFATYTNLPPGDYTFRATGTNSDGVWSDRSTTININVPYPFWQTWWFATLLILAVVGTAVAAFRLRTRNSEARTRELEEQVAVRTTEIQARREIAEGLREILILLNSNRSLEESLHYIVAQAARLTDAEDAIIFRHEPDEPMTIMATNPGGRIRYSPDAAIINVTGNWVNEGLLDNQPLVIPDFIVYWLAHPEIRSGSQENYHAVLGIPLHLGNEVYGGLLMFYNQIRNFSDEDLELGFTFADQAALAIANDRLREQAKQTAVAMERSRLARELHDAVTQTIFSASLIAETVPPVWETDQEEGRKLLQELRQLTRGALAEMRTLLLELRPAALEESRLPDLLKQLSEAVTGRTGVPVRTQVKETCEIPVNVKVALYRIAQESLNNVMKHARASNVEVSLSGCSHGNGVLLSVEDDGRGFDLSGVPADRLGLKIIRERAQAIGASLSIETQPGQGTQVSVEWHEGQ
jgi:signal transduction histidine kinase